MSEAKDSMLKKNVSFAGSSNCSERSSDEGEGGSIIQNESQEQIRDEELRACRHRWRFYKYLRTLIGRREIFEGHARSRASGSQKQPADFENHLLPVMYSHKDTPADVLTDFVNR
ncbi:hypothetical protein EVAR_60700_1 [Eumeta japonica]|uniref:Uncharacterized protein n=1 Tax=Eumeta variegata TaxID=151549 RepID=A0A4C1ZD71_EUMVA|nr:hypothetical protein EVAR_60700_1 [Eumeta japonica]